MTVHCGQTLTHSVKLANDLTDCPGDGLVIGAAGITVDLNGHTIDGVAPTSCDVPGVATAGVANRDGYDGVTVKDGAIRQFGFGVFANDMSDGVERGLTVSDSHFAALGVGGTRPVDAQHNLVTHNVVPGACGFGIAVFPAQDNRVAANRVRDTRSVAIVATSGRIAIEDNSVSGTPDVGIAVLDVGASRIAGNAVTDVGDDAIIVVGASSGTVVQGNAIARAQHAGVGVRGEADEAGEFHVPSDVRVSGNALTSTGEGIWLIATDRGVVTRNSVTGAGSIGGPNTFGVGVLLIGASDTRVSRNTITDGGRGIGPGIGVGLPPEFGPSPRQVTGNVIERNSVSGQHADGIAVAPEARDTTLVRNTANGNAADGIRVLNPFTTITRNTANDNGAYGIEAVPGVADGGHNEASGNGNPAQCVEVACS
jgi:parallel beta-helix repeat protein